MASGERKLTLYSYGKKECEKNIPDRSCPKAQYALEDFTEEEIAYLKEVFKEEIEAYRKNPLLDFALLARLVS